MSAFKQWWAVYGQFLCAGGGEYEKTFWNAALEHAARIVEISESREIAAHRIRKEIEK